MAGDGHPYRDEPANSTLTGARPGEEWDLWVTGLGVADGNDAEAPSEDDNAVPVEVLVGGTPAEVLYRGAAACCPGYGRIRFRIPDEVGCCEPVVVRLEGVDSNQAAISIASNGGACTDSNIPAEVLDALRREGPWKMGTMNLVRITPLGEGRGTLGFVASEGSFVEYDVRGLYRYDCMGQTSAVVPGPLNISTKTIGSCIGSRVRIDFAGVPAPGPVALPLDTISRGRGLDAGSAFTITGALGAVEIPKASASDASSGY